MKILLVHNYYRYRGGEETYFSLLSALLRKKGHKVVIYTKDNRNISSNFMLLSKISAGLFHNREVDNELSSLISKRRPDIAHFNNIYPLITPTAYDVCRQHNIPIVQSIHNYRFLCPEGHLFKQGQICELCVKSRFTWPAVRFDCYSNSKIASLFFTASNFFHFKNKTFQKIDKFIFPSIFVRNYYSKFLNLPKEKTHYLPHFVNVDNKNNKNIEKEDFFLFVGRLSEEKGIIQLLDIFKTLKKVRLIVIGDGPLIHEVNKYKKFKNISIKGFLERRIIYQYIKKSIAVIIPSVWYEICPFVLVESFANETPVIVPRQGAFLGLVRDHKTGFFYNPREDEDLIDKIKLVIKNRKKLKSMRETIQTYFLNNHTEDVHYDKLTRIYQQIL